MKLREMVLKQRNVNAIFRGVNYDFMWSEPHTNRAIIPKHPQLIRPDQSSRVQLSLCPLSLCHRWHTGGTSTFKYMITKADLIVRICLISTAYNLNVIWASVCYWSQFYSEAFGHDQEYHMVRSLTALSTVAKCSFSQVFTLNIWRRRARSAFMQKFQKLKSSSIWHQLSCNFFLNLII